MDQALLGIAEVLGNKREEILAISAYHGASNIRIFGSVTREEALVKLQSAFPKNSKALIQKFLGDKFLD